MEPHVVQAIVLALLDNPHPGRCVSGREASLRKTTVLHRSPQMYAVSVEQDILSLNGNLTETESHTDRFAIHVDCSGVKLRLVLVPRLGIRHLHHILLIINGDTGCACGEVGDDALPIDDWCSHQFYATRNAIPVALCLVGDAVRVLTYTDILYSVVNTDFYRVLFPETHGIRDVILMWHTQRQLMAHFVSVYHDRCLDMRSLQEQGHALFLPCLRNYHSPFVRHFAYEMLRRGQEEW